MSSTISLEKQQQNPLSRRILLFNLVADGHYANYLQYLIEYWQVQKNQGKLFIVVLEEFIDLHPDVVNLAAKDESKSIEFVVIKPEEAILKPTSSAINRLIRDFQEWRLLYQYTQSLGVNHCLMMIADRYLIPLTFQRLHFSCAVSGIYYRPSFHYIHFEDYKPTLKERIQHLREKFLVSQGLRNSSLKTLFLLDSFAVEAINQSLNLKKAVYMPDPVKRYRDSELNVEKIQKNLKIQPHRKVFLLLGSIGERRGIYQLLDAVALLPDSICQELCLLLVGKVVASEEELVTAKIASISQFKPVQIISHFEFISELDVHSYFRLSDVILSPHQKHIGMSGTLVLAAAAQKPVLSSNYGLMGEMVKRYDLGLTVDSTIPAEIAQGLTRFIREPESVLCNYPKMKQFADNNSTEKFSEVIFKNL